MGSHNKQLKKAKARKREEYNPDSNLPTVEDHKWASRLIKNIKSGRMSEIESALMNPIDKDQGMFEDLIDMGTFITDIASLVDEE